MARGSAPAAVALLAWLFVDEALGVWSWVGLFLASLGIGALAMGGGRAGRPSVRSVTLALVTGVLITAYTLVDGIGMRASEAPYGYIAWAFAMWGVVFAGGTVLVLRRSPFGSSRRYWTTATASGLLSTFAYGIILYALGAGPMAEVSALRESSVLFAAVIGAVRLNESFGSGRILAASAIVIGLIMLKLHL